MLSGELFLVLGQGRWSGFRLTSGFPIAAALPGPFLSVNALLSRCGPDDGLRPSSLVANDEPLLLDSLLLVPAQERWAGIRLASRFPFIAAEGVLRTVAPVVAPRSLFSIPRTPLGRVVRPLACSLTV